MNNFIRKYFRNLSYFPIIDELCFFITKRANKFYETTNRKVASIHASVKIGNNCLFDKNVKNVIIDEGSYCGSYCQFFAGKNSKIIIGKYCAIGYNVHIKARTHDLIQPCPAPDKPNKEIEDDIIIEDEVWIGDNVFIRNGVKIGRGSVIGANSVVTKNIDPFCVYAGVPAIKIKDLQK